MSFPFCWIFLQPSTPLITAFWCQEQGRIGVNGQTLQWFNSYLEDRYGISINQYANDAQLYLPFDQDRQEEAIARMEACVNDIRIWMNLKLNKDKAELIVIAPTKQAHKVTIDTITIGYSVVKASTAAKNIGATFDATHVCP